MSPVPAASPTPHRVVTVVRVPALLGSLSRVTTSFPGRGCRASGPGGRRSSHPFLTCTLKAAPLACGSLGGRLHALETLISESGDRVGPLPLRGPSRSFSAEGVPVPTLPKVRSVICRLGAGAEASVSPLGLPACPPTSETKTGCLHRGHPSFTLGDQEVARTP